MLKDVKNNDVNKKDLIDKYNDLYKASEKLFDKLLNPNLKPEELNIIRIMLQKKQERDSGIIEKLDADKEIGEVLCDTYVKPMLNKKK
tara:strand:- start:4522 stop:4785 length:264 start_codon:yes stop_codon:yes gene_type:complete